MRLARGGALTALTLLIAIGCGGSDVVVPGGQNSPADDAGVVEVIGPDGGVVTAPAPPEGPPVGGEPPPTGVFVSASKGIDGADGTRSRPLKTIADGLALAKQKKAPLIVCAETYPEQVVLADGVTMFGYFDCSNPDKWERKAKNAKIAAPASPGVLAENLFLPAAFEGFDIEVPDIAGTAPVGTPAATSYGMIIKTSKNLSFGELSIRAGKGQDGIDGVEPAPNVEQSTSTEGAGAGRQGVTCRFNVPSEKCGSRSKSDGQRGGTSKCAVGSAGGPGGTGGDGPFARNGTVLTPTNDDAHGRPRATNDPLTAQGGVHAMVDRNAVGTAGATGKTGDVGANGAWRADATGIVPGGGSAGANGGPGQGGGGGGGSMGWMTSTYDSSTTPPATGEYYGATGAGGGAGGCGGVAGTPGTGGGGSVGVFIVSSTAISIAHTKIEAGKGGRAGAGAVGTNGLSGAFGGFGRYPDNPQDARPDGTYGLRGGRGGAGGTAGMSGNGSAGPSIALLYNGTRPNIDDKTTGMFAGQAGDGVPEKTSGGKTRPAVVGASLKELVF